MYFSINIKIPSLSEEWNFKSITTLQQKEICKSLLINNNNILIHTFNRVIKDCLEPSNDFNKLTITDKIVILLKLRWESIGDSIEIEIEKDAKKYSSTYSIIDVAERFTNVCSNITPFCIEEQSFKITCNNMYVKHEAEFIKLISNSDSTYEDILPFFITNIEINNQSFSLPIEEIRAVVSTLPAGLYQKLIIHIKSILRDIYSVKIYSYLDEEILFNFNTIYIDFLKFLFKEDLYGIYQEIYLLNKTAGFDSNYVEGMSPLERQLYISFITQERQQNSKPSSAVSQDTLPNNSVDSFDSFMNEMGG